MAGFRRSVLRTQYRAYVRLRLGEAYEQLGDTDKALHNYRGFLIMWADADERLTPVSVAMEAVSRLGG